MNRPESSQPGLPGNGAKKRERRVFFAFLTAFCVVAVALIAALGTDWIAFRGEIHPGVKLAGKDLGKLSRPAAEALIAQICTPLLEKKITITDGVNLVTLTPDSSGVISDVKATVDLCLSQGRSGFLENCVARLRLWLHPRAIDPILSVSGPGWQRVLDQVSLAFEKQAVDARLVVVDGGLSTTQAQPGAVLNEQLLATRVLQAIARGPDHVAPPMLATPPAVTSGQAAEVAATARKSLAAPVTLEYQGNSYPLTTEELAQAVSVDDEALARGGLPFTLDNDAGRAILSRLLAPIGRVPLEAKVLPAADGKGYTVAPSRDGVEVEWDALFPALAQALLQPAPRRVAVPTAVAHPKLTTDDAEQLAVRRDIASFTTYFPSSNQARVHNIQQVALQLDGTVVPPGTVFSFNKTVGPRTQAAGFDEAPMILDGVLVPGVGGGTCQASTTLFNAVFLAGLPIVERHAHSLFIDHYPVGRDATVTYGAEDFRFRNDSGQYILISAAATDRSFTVSLAAPSWDRVVSYTTSPLEDVKKPSSTAQYPRYLLDPSLKPGISLPLEPGIDGCTVEVSRVVRNAQGLTLFTDDFTSVYAPKDFIVRVGPK